ncbi:hypothetical protein T8K17_13320 [Thalassobaculum sp. OXR-137]|uniref:hypothetical protein n=1 Tax=Thalassobaculum sp. OXR-137 TaxID=3100173 RepID=UPI002AC913C9|nr:hypothetical protein [Thalassobaculum sp. OXR-137]WPZ32222.1 hypothetical protein T8K17_13320 [Thalassobaculum sp. OXR-137]
MAKQQLNVRLPAEYIDAARDIATSRGVTLTQFITDALRRAIAQDEDLSVEHRVELVEQSLARLHERLKTEGCESE